VQNLFTQILKLVLVTLKMLSFLNPTINSNYLT